MVKKVHPLYLEDLQQIVDCIPALKKGTNFLVTGATGLIGSLIVDALLYYKFNNDSSIMIHALGRDRSRLEKRFLWADVEKRPAYIQQDICAPIPDDQDFDYIFHCASNADPGTYAKYPAETITTNVIGTYHILEYAKMHPNVQIVFTSTIEVYGTMPSGYANCENDFGKVDFNQIRSGYPESKRTAELLCRSYVKEYNISVKIARLGYIYGPTMTKTDSKVIAQFIRNALNHENIVMKSKGTQKRSYCYSADTVSAIFQILFKGEVGEAYNVANSQSGETIVGIAQILSELSGTSVNFELPAELEKEGYSKPQDSILNENKLLALNWKARYTLREGLKRTITILGN